MIKRLITTIALSLALFGCGTTNYDRVASAQVTNTSVLQLIGVGASTGKLTKKDAENLVKQVDLAQEGINIAATLDPASGASKLTQVQTILNGVNDYLAKKGVSAK